MAPGDTSNERPLSALVRTLAASVDGNPGQAILAGLLAPFGATCVLVHALRVDHLSLIAHAGVPDDVAQRYAAVGLSTLQPMTGALLDGRDRLLSTDQWAATFPLSAPLCRSIQGNDPAMGVHVIRRGGVPIGTLAVGFRDRPESGGDLHDRLGFLTDTLAIWSGPTRPSSASAPAIPAISPRQREIIARVSEGQTNPQIAESLRVSVATVKADLAELYSLVGAKGRRDLPPRAIRAGL